MRYRAFLQRFDDAHFEVACGDDRAQVIAAATALYTALVPQIIAGGKPWLEQQARDEQDQEDNRGPDEDTHDYDRYWRGQLQRARQFHELSPYLRAQEYGIAVYERAVRQAGPDQPVKRSDELIFWIGSTQHDPDLD